MAKKRPETGRGKSRSNSKAKPVAKGKATGKVPKGKVPGKAKPVSELGQAVPERERGRELFEDDRPSQDKYKFIRATVNEDGDLSWEYQLQGSDVVGRQSHDEFVGDWSDQQIKDLTRQTLDVAKDDPVDIELDSIYVPSDDTDEGENGAG